MNQDESIIKHDSEGFSLHTYEWDASILFGDKNSAGL